MKFNKKIITFILVNFILLLFGVYNLATSCEGTVSECLLGNEKYFNDFAYQYNIIKYISVHHSIPYEAVYYEDGGYDGVSSEAYKQPVYREPLYYMLGALIYLVSQIIRIPPLLFLHIFSTIIILVTNLLFFLFVKKLSSFINIDKRRFILYSMILFIFLPPHMYIALGVQNDVLFYLFFIASLYAYVRLVEKKTIKEAVLFGLFVGLSLLSRLSALTLIASLILILGYYFIKRDYLLVKLYSLSLLISLLIGGFTFIRNKILFGSIFGGLLNYIGLDSPPQKNFRVFIRVYRGFWGGLEGGNNNTYFLLVFICLVLTVLTIYGLLIYKKEIKNKSISIFLTILLGIIILFALNWDCKISVFLTSLKCIGYELQSRFIITLCPFIALLSSFGLINLEKRYKRLTKIMPFFVILTAVLFSIDFITALLKL